MKKVIAMLLVLSMVVVGATVFAREEPVIGESGYELYRGYDLGGITIDFWNFITGEDNKTLTRWVNKFNEENPYGVTINQDSMDGSVLSQKLPVALASNTGPQMTMGGVDIPAFADQGMILELSDIFEYTDLKREDFIDGLLDITSYEDGLYGIPFYIGATFMFWNKDLYRQAGLDPEQPPETWDELYANSVAISALGDEYYGLNFAWGLHFSIYDVMANFGGKIITIDEDTGLYKNELYSDENLEALGFWQNFYKEGLNPVDASDNLFYSGIIGTILAGPWAGGIARNEYGLDVGFGLAPGAKAGNYYFCACINMNITNNAKTFEEILACYVWMSYWNTPEPCIDFSLENSTPVYLVPAAGDERITSNADIAAMSNFEGRTAWNWIPVGFTYGSDVIEQMLSLFEALALGGDLETSLKTISDNVDEIIEEANAKRIADGKATAP